jgi:uncharacterized protein (DUF305 family)
MATIDFESLLKNLEDEISSLAVSTVKDYADQAKKDGKNMIETLKTDLQNWGQQVIDGKLSKDDLEFLVMSKKELIQMNALKQAGLALVKIDEFKNSVLTLIVNGLTALI